MKELVPRSRAVAQAGPGAQDLYQYIQRRPRWTMHELNFADS